MAKKNKTIVIYDKENPHLGGNSLDIHPPTYATGVWDYIIEKYNIKSTLDIGSGMGHAAKYFADKGLESYAIEGMERNCREAVHPTECVDLTKGTYNKPVDLVNCIEVVEHIEEKYIDNLLNAMCNGKYILMTHGLPGQPGHHHVNNQLPEYWINHLDARGYNLLDEKEMIVKRSGAAHHIADSGMLFERR